MPLEVEDNDGKGVFYRKGSPLTTGAEKIRDMLFGTDIIIANTVLPGGAKGKSDVFWVQGEMGLIKAIVLYCVTMLPKEHRNMGSFYSMITTGMSTYLDGLFSGVKPGSPARLSYNISAVSRDCP